MGVYVLCASCLRYESLLLQRGKSLKSRLGDHGLAKKEEKSRYDNLSWSFHLPIMCLLTVD